jgi:hypothetical protein
MGREASLEMPEGPVRHDSPFYIHPAQENRCFEEIEKIRKEVEAAAGDVKLYERLLITASEMILAYIIHWRHTDKDWETLAYEQKFEIPLENGWLFQGKMDKLARWKTDGLVYLWERKTTAQTGESYYQRLRCDSQIKGYCLAVQRTGYGETRNVLYDVLKKPLLRQRNSEDDISFAQRLGEEYVNRPEKYFERRNIVFTQEELDDYYCQLVYTTRMIEMCLDEGYWVQNCSPARKGGCIYFPLCVEGEGTWAEKLFTFRPPEFFHPELAVTEEE